jgi:hypothetical protein
MEEILTTDLICGTSPAERVEMGLRAASQGGS